MGAKNKYSEILYCATLLIVMLSAREISFIPFTVSGAKIHAKLAVFRSVLGYLLELSFFCSLPMPRYPRRQGFSAVKSHCAVQ